MIALFICVAAVVLLNVAASRWGVDSRDGFHSAEWERRRRWLAFH
jgi:hypothetical protein